MVSLGFEFEFLAPQGSQALVEYLSDHKIDTYASLPDRILTYDKFYIVPDGSIRKLGLSCDTMEIITPVFSRDEGIDCLHRILNILKDTKCVTNSSCGLHVGIGLPTAQIEVLDPLKLVLFLNENHWLRAFNRVGNPYCRSLRLALERNVRSLVKTGKKPDTLDTLRNLIVWNKYYTVNLTKLKQGYLEFRIIGNVDYHLKDAVIDKAIEHFIYCVEASAYADVEPDKYNYLVDKLRHSADWINKTA